MSHNYASAAMRHLDDARWLHNAGRYDTSAYLAGYVAECAVKILLRSKHLQGKAVGHDLHSLTTDVVSMLWVVAPSLCRYSLRATPELKDLVDKWSPEGRYNVTGTYDMPVSETWIAAANQVFDSIVVEAILDGWIDLE